MMPTALQTRVVVIAPPDNLLVLRPIIRVESVSKNGIAKGYIPNTIQLGIANKQLKAIRDWKVEQLKLYGDNPHGSPNTGD